MAEGLTPNLILAAACVWVFGVILSARKLPLPIAIALSTIKLAVPLVYFAYYAGTWVFLDDLKYQTEGAGMLEMGYTPISAITTADGLLRLGAFAGGEHILYGWWNLLAQWIFGEHYWAPVFLNVGLTFVAALFLERALDLLGMSKAYRRWAMAFFLVHWDVIAWSSLINLKDTLVMTITMIGLVAMLRLIQRFSFRRLVPVILVAFLVTWIRFYLTGLMLLALGLWFLFQWRDRRKYLLLAAIVLAGILFVRTNIGHVADIDLTYFPIGLFRTLLTPLPWNIDPSYTFLTIPAVMNWLTLGLLVAGGFSVWREGGAGRLPVIYAVVVLLFYAVAPEIEGPRQKFQIVPVCAWLEFHAAWMLLQSWRTQKAKMRAGILNASPEGVAAPAEG